MQLTCLPILVLLVQLLAVAAMAQGRPSAYQLALQGVRGDSKGLVRARPNASVPWGTLSIFSTSHELAMALCANFNFPPSSLSYAYYTTASGGANQIYGLTCDEPNPHDGGSGSHGGGSFSHHDSHEGASSSSSYDSHDGSSSTSDGGHHGWHYDEELLAKCRLVPMPPFYFHDGDLGLNCQSVCPEGEVFERVPGPPNSGGGKGTCKTCAAPEAFALPNALNCTAACPPGTHSSTTTAGVAICAACGNETMSATAGAPACAACPIAPSGAVLYPSVNRTACRMPQWQWRLGDDGAAGAQSSGIAYARPNSSAPWGSLISFFITTLSSTAFCHAVGFPPGRVTGSFYTVSTTLKGPAYQYTCASDVFSADQCSMAAPLGMSDIAFVHMFDTRIACDIACPPGTALLNRTCAACPEATFASLDQRRCVAACDPGAYADTALGACVRCPSGTVNAQGGASSVGACTQCSSSALPNSNGTACVLRKFDIRLVGGTLAEGQLELSPVGKRAWGSVEYWRFGDSAAQAACHQLGFPENTNASYYNGGTRLTLASSYAVNCLNGPTVPYYLEMCEILPIPISFTVVFLQCVANCPRGTFFASNRTCVICPEGTFSSTDRLSCVTSCPAGSFSNPDTATCQKCLPGTYAPGNGSLTDAACHPCDPGTFGPTAGLAECSLCPPSTYNPFPGETSCYPCASGSLTSDDRTSCDPLEWEFRFAPQDASASTAADVASGRVEVRPNSTAEWGTVCGLSFGTTEALAACRSLGFPFDVKASWFIAGGGSGPIYMEKVYCGKDAYLENCSLWPSSGECDHSTDVGVTCTVPCPPGTVADAATGGCTGCEDGTFSSVDQLHCTATCGPGAVGNLTSMACETCPEGTYAQDGFETCEPCPPGTYQDQTGQDQCTPCPSGLYNPNYGATGAFNCFACDAGEAPNADASGCEPIAWEVRLLDTQGLPTASGKGTVELRAGNASAWQRAIIRGSNVTAAVLCRTLGYTTQELVAYVILPPLPPLRAPKYYVDCSNDPWAQDISSCTVRSSSVTRPVPEAAIVCLASCPSGQYFSGGVCTECDAATPLTSVDSLSCVAECPAGAYANLVLAACLPCPFGTVNARAGATNASACTACPAGHNADATQTRCVAQAFEVLIDGPGMMGALLVRRSAAEPWNTFPEYAYFTPEMANAACRSAGFDFLDVVGTTFTLEGYTFPYGDASPMQVVCGALEVPLTYLQQCNVSRYSSYPRTVPRANSGGATQDARIMPPVSSKPIGLRCVAGCASGYVYNISRAACGKCPRGLFVDVTGTKCVAACPAGTYAQAPVCVECKAGTYNPTPGATSAAACSLCGTGTYAATERSTACAACAPNQYLDQTGAGSPYACKSCMQPNTFRDRTGSGCVDAVWTYNLTAASSGFLSVSPAPWLPFGYISSWSFSRENAVQACHSLGFGPDVVITLARPVAAVQSSGMYLLTCDEAAWDLDGCTASFELYYYMSAPQIVLSCALATQCIDFNGQSPKNCANSSTLDCFYCAATDTCMPPGLSSAADLQLACPSYTDVCGSWSGSQTNCSTFVYRPAAAGSVARMTWSNRSCDASSCGRCFFCVDRQLCVTAPRFATACGGAAANGPNAWCATHDGDPVACNNALPAPSRAACNATLFPGGCGRCAFCASSSRCMTRSAINASSCCGFRDLCSVWSSLPSMCPWHALVTQPTGAQSAWGVCNFNYGMGGDCSCFFNASGNACQSLSSFGTCGTFSSSSFQCNMGNSRFPSGCTFCTAYSVCMATSNITAAVCPSYVDACSRWNDASYYCTEPSYNGGGGGRPNGGNSSSSSSLSCFFCSATSVCYSGAGSYVCPGSTQAQCQQYATAPYSCASAGCTVCASGGCEATSSSTCTPACALFSDSSFYCALAAGCAYCQYSMLCAPTGTVACDPCNTFASSQVCNTKTFNYNWSNYLEPWQSCPFGSTCAACGWCSASASCVVVASLATDCKTLCGQFDAQPEDCTAAAGCRYCSGGDTRDGSATGMCYTEDTFDALCDPCLRLKDRYSCNALVFSVNSSSFQSACPADEECITCMFCTLTGKCRSEDSMSLRCPGWKSPCDSRASWECTSPNRVSPANCTLCNGVCVPLAAAATCPADCAAWSNDQAGCGASSRCQFCVTSGIAPDVIAMDTSPISPSSSALCIPAAHHCSICSLPASISAPTACTARQPMYYETESALSGKCGFCAASSECMPLLANASASAGGLAFPCTGWVDVCSSFNANATLCNLAQYNRTGHLVVDATRCSGGRCAACGYCASTQRCVKASTLSSATCAGYVGPCSMWDGQAFNCSTLALQVPLGVWQRPPCTNASCLYCGFCPASGKCFALGTYSSQCGQPWTGPCGMFSAATCPTNASLLYVPASNAVDQSCGAASCCPHTCAVCATSKLCNTVPTGGDACSAMLRPAVVAYIPPAPAPTAVPPATTPTPATNAPPAAVPVDIIFTFVSTSGLNHTLFLAALAALSPGGGLDGNELAIVAFNATTIMVQFPSLTAAAAASSSTALAELRNDGFAGLLGASAPVAPIATPASPASPKLGIIIGVVIAVLVLVFIAVGYFVFKRHCGKVRKATHVDFPQRPEDFEEGVVNSEGQRPTPRTGYILPMATIQEGTVRRATAGEAI